MDKENMELWDAVCTTNPKHTTKVNTRGGFTAISAQYQLQRATELWGSYGNKWGVKDCKYNGDVDDGGEMIEATLEAVFYYPDGEFEISTDMKYSAGNDTRKKLLTDLTTKALSKLGFNADVFMGKFDDNKYVKKLEEEFNEGAPAKDPLTDKPKPKVEKKEYNTSELSEMIRRARIATLNEWAIGFLSNIETKCEKFDTMNLTADQYNKLLELAGFGDDAEVSIGLAKPVLSNDPIIDDEIPFN